MFKYVNGFRKYDNLDNLIYSNKCFNSSCSDIAWKYFSIFYSVLYDDGHTTRQISEKTIKKHFTRLQASRINEKITDIRYRKHKNTRSLQFNPYVNLILKQTELF